MIGLFQAAAGKAAFLLVALGLCLSRARAAVVINEIHYNSAEGAPLEFVELRNLEPVAVSLGGWRFNEGIQLIFPEEAVIEAGGFVVVCQNRAEVIARFSLPPESVHGDFTGALDNGGETITPVDAAGTIVDQVKYDDDAPWDRNADGAGASLERVCASFDVNYPAN